ncbi:GPI mannosyltransferase 1, partial [Thraustotheca clavata]
MESRTAIVFGIGLIARLVCLAWGEYQDHTMVLKYTDVDYDVYSDAAREVVLGNSPFDRTTYRYTPLLAYILLPNVFVHEAWGKLLFVASDMIVGYLIFLILKLRMIKERDAASYTSVWLFHPFSINISTRGNADTLVVLLCILSLYLLLKKQLVLSALVYGLAVHFKIYPIVYALAFLVFLDEDYDPSLSLRPAPKSFIGKCIQWLNWHRIAFGLISGGLFLLLTGFFYVIYGYTFLFEGYLYHFSRTDNRHNFSMYFYDLYLRYGTSGGFMMGLIAFLPQFLTLFNISFRCGKDIIFAQFLLTICFV